MDARNVPVDYSYRWIFCSIEIAKQFYSLFLGCGLLMFVTVICIGFVPFIGHFVAAIMSILYGVGTLRLVRQVVTTERGTFDDFLKFTFDASHLHKYVPLFIAVCILNFISAILTFAHIHFLSLPMLALSNIVVLICVHAAYMMDLQPSLSWREATERAASGTWMNIVTLIIAVIFLSIFGVLSALMCGVGLFLYFLPMTMPINFLIFTSIYENRDVEATIKEWSSKSNEVKTVPAPTDEP